MSTFANQLKNEISRLAKREVRAEVQALKKASTAYRGEIAALKPRIAGPESQVKKLGKGAVRTKAVEEAAQDMAEGLRFRVAGFAFLRKKLGISAAEMGQLLGVSAQSERARPNPEPVSWLPLLLYARWASGRSQLSWRSELNAFLKFGSTGLFKLMDGLLDKPETYYF